MGQMSTRVFSTCRPKYHPFPLPNIERIEALWWCDGLRFGCEQGIIKGIPTDECPGKKTKSHFKIKY